VFSSMKKTTVDVSEISDNLDSVERRKFLGAASGVSAGLITATRAPWLLTGSMTAAAVIPGTALAAAHEVKAIQVKFDPVFVYIDVGDRIDWTNMAGHLIETIESMSPEGAEMILTEMGKDVSHTYEVEGIHVYKCTPHWGARMGGIVVVGKPEDPVAILDGYLASLETEKENLPAKGLIKKLKKDMEAKGMI